MSLCSALQRSCLVSLWAGTCRTPCPTCLWNPVSLSPSLSTYPPNWTFLVRRTCYTTWTTVNIHTNTSQKQHHLGPFWFVPSNLRSISASASPEPSHYNQDRPDCSLIEERQNSLCPVMVGQIQGMWFEMVSVPPHFTFNRDIA